MNQHRNTPQQDQQTGEPNPTLNAPGSKVADYGNPTGGSADGSPAETDATGSNPERSGREATDSGTVGNP